MIHCTLLSIISIGLSCFVLEVFIGRLCGKMEAKEDKYDQEKNGGDSE